MSDYPDKTVQYDEIRCLMLPPELLSLPRVFSQSRVEGLFLMVRVKLYVAGLMGMMRFV